MIFEGSCDTKDAKSSASHHMNKLHFKIYLNKKKVILNCNNCSQYYYNAASW